MNTDNAKRIKDVLIAILIIVGVLAILPAIFIAIVTILSALIAGFSFANIALVEMMSYWSINVWTSLFYLGLLIAEIGLLIIIVPLLVWAAKWLIKAVKWVINAIKMRLGGNDKQ